MYKEKWNDDKNWQKRKMVHMEVRIGISSVVHSFACFNKDQFHLVSACFSLFHQSHYTIELCDHTHTHILVYNRRKLLVQRCLNIRQCAGLHIKVADEFTQFNWTNIHIFYSVVISKFLFVESLLLIFVSFSWKICCDIWKINVRLLELNVIRWR